MNRHRRRMRVLQLGKFAPPCHGGVERAIDELLPELRRRGIEVACLAHGHAGRAPGIQRRHGQWVDAAPVAATLLYAPISLQLPLRLRAWLRRWSPDLLHLHMPNPACFWALLLPEARRLPWLVHWHADVAADVLDRRLRLAYRLYRPWEQALLRRAQRILVSSPPYLEHSQALAAHRARCEVLPLGLAESGLSAAANPTAWPGAGLRILCVGRLTYYKGHGLLLEALRGLEQAQALIVGDGELRAQLQQRIAALGLSDRVELRGSVDDAGLAALYRDCDLLCLPSLDRSEAYGLVLLEAMRAGRPIVCSRLAGSGMSWILDEGVTGLGFAPGDAADLRRVLARLGAEPELRKRMGEAGRARFRQYFGVARCADGLIGIYDAVRVAAASGHV